MQPNHLKLTAIVLAAFSTVTATVNAAITFQDIDGQQARVDFDTITLLSPPGNFNGVYIVFEDFFVNDATAAGTAVSGSFNWSLNNTTSGTQNHQGFSGQFSTPPGVIDTNDLVLNAETIFIFSGDVLRIDGVNLVYNSNSTVLTPTGAASYNVFMTDYTGDIRSEVITVAAVPEPSSMILLGLGVLGFASRRRRK